MAVSIYISTNSAVGFSFFHIFIVCSFLMMAILIGVASLVAQLVKSLPAMWETWVQSLDWEHLLEKEMATHSSILAWRMLWTEKPGGLQFMASQRVGHD